MKFKVFSILAIMFLSMLSPILAKEIYVVPLPTSEFLTIQEAYDDEDTVDGDVIVLAPVVFVENLVLTGKRVTIRSESPSSKAETIINGRLDETAAVYINGDGADGTIIQDITIKGAESHGIDIRSSSVTITNCIITENSDKVLYGSFSHGTGIYSRDNSGTTIEGCSIYNNIASNSCGCGIAIDCCENVLISDCQIYDNTSEDDGGGLFIIESSDIMVTDCDFENNSSHDGGAIASNSSEPVCFRGCTFTGNQARNGGAIFLLSGNTIFVNCEFISNIAQSDGAVVYGGAIFEVESKDVQLSNCVFRANRANSDDANAYGGAICNANSSPKITNCTFKGNFANKTSGGNGYGGAIYNRGGSCPVIVNSIFRVNVSVDEVVNGSDDDVPEFWSCLVYGSGGSGENWNADLGVDRGGNIDAYPYFVSDTNLRLMSVSNCIDAGSTYLAPKDIVDIDGDGNTSEYMPTDLDGNKRFSNSTSVADSGDAPFSGWIVVDMGAYEYQDSSFGSTPGDIDNSGKVDFADFAVLADKWLAD